MPFLSRSQQKWAHAPPGTAALGGTDKVKEWDQSTDFSNLPEKKMADKKTWLGGAIKRPGKLTAEAKSSGRSKLHQAEVDSHSKDPSKRGRGLLGMRLIKGHGKP